MVSTSRLNQPGRNITISSPIVLVTGIGTTLMTISSTRTNAVFSLVTVVPLIFSPGCHFLLFDLSSTGNIILFDPRTHKYFLAWNNVHTLPPKDYRF